MIVSTLEQVQKYLPSFNMKVKVDRLKDFLDRAQQWLVDHVIGTDIEDILEIDIAENASDPHERLRTLASRIICELAYLTAIAELDLQLSEAGFVVANNEKMSPASQQRTDRLVLSMKSRMCTDCDNLVKYLLVTTAYEDWLTTDQFNYLSRAFIPTTVIMRQYSGPMEMDSWEDFYELVPKMEEALRGRVADYISNDEVDALLTLYRTQTMNENQKKVLRWIRMATMCYLNKQSNPDHFAIEARNWMLAHEADFQEFVHSDRYELPKPFNLGDGTVANLL